MDRRTDSFFYVASPSGEPVWTDLSVQNIEEVIDTAEAVETDSPEGEATAKKIQEAQASWTFINKLTHKMG